MKFLKALPFILLYKRSSMRETIKKDVSHWIERLAPSLAGRPVLECILFFLHKEFTEEFRDLLYYRFGTPKHPLEKILLSLVKLLYKPRGTVRIETPLIGPGILIMHGVGTVIQAERIGEHLLIFQEVVIAPKMDGVEGKPIIGNDVRISAGAKIIGPVTIGDHSIIGPNAVITKDVPPKCIATGIPTRIVSLERSRN